MTRTIAPATPLPSDRMRVGACEVDIPLREIRAPGVRRPMRITPKSMAVLLELAQAPGRVVARDQLLAQVWPDTLPTNDVLTQAITQLRKALRESRDYPRYIETIAKTGYRLLAPVEWLTPLPAAVPVVGDGAVSAVAADVGSSELAERTAATAPVAAGQPVVSGRRRLRTLLLAAGVLGLGAALATPWLIRREGTVRVYAPVAVRNGQASTPSDFRLITSAPGFEVAPTLSPDAGLVAYVARPAGQPSTALFVQPTDPTPPRQLTRPPQGYDDDQPAWSPDGRRLAFVRLRSGRECVVRITPVTGGDGRAVGACDPRNVPTFDWSPDGRSLVFSSRAYPGAGPGLQRLDIATGRWTRIAYPAHGNDIDTAPRYAPDGRSIVFVRNPPLGDFWRVPSAGGEAKPLARLGADVEGWDFTTDGRAIIYSRWQDSESRLFQLDIASGVARELGLRDGEQPAIASRADALAFSQQRNYFGLYRFDAAGAGSGTRLFPSSGRDRMPAIAPDGRQLVFASDRSGRFGLWWADLDRPDSLRLLDGLLPESRHLPEWSADSQHLLLVGRDDEGRTGLYEVEPASGRIVRLPVPGGEPVQAVYGGAGRVYVIAGGADRHLTLTLYDRHSTPWRALASVDDVAVMHFDREHDALRLTRTGRAGLWQADARLSPDSVRLLDAERPTALRYRQWTVGPTGALLLVERAEGCSALLRRGLEDPSPRCLDPQRYAAINGLSADPRSGAIYVSLSESLGGDIGFMRLDVNGGGRAAAR